MSSILSTQNRHIFLRRKYCFLPITALSPPVGREEPLMGLPPLVSAITTPCPQWIQPLLRAVRPVPRDRACQEQVPPEARASPEPLLPESREPSAPEPVVARRAYREPSCAWQSSSAFHRYAR